MRAARRFDPKRGFRFSTFAHWWIRQGISRFVKGPTRTVRLPEYVQDRIARTLTARRELRWGRAEEPTPDEIGSRVGLGGAQVKKLIEYSKDATSMDVPVSGTDGLQVRDTVIDNSRLAPEEEVERRSKQNAMVAGLKNLPSRETKILAYRFGLADGKGRSRPWIGKKMGLSAERVRQIEKRALGKLRVDMGSLEDSGPRLERSGTL